MSWGFEFYNSNGDVQLSSDDIAWQYLNTIHLDKNSGNGSVVVNKPDPTQEVVAFYIPSGSPAGGEHGSFTLSVDGNTDTVSWEWVWSQNGIYGNSINPSNSDTWVFTECVVYLFIK